MNIGTEPSTLSMGHSILTEHKADEEHHVDSAQRNQNRYESDIRLRTVHLSVRSTFRHDTCIIHDISILFPIESVDTLVTFVMQLLQTSR